MDYIQLLMIGRVIQVMKVNQNAKKAPLNHQKMKCSFLDYVQLLMISQVIQATIVNRNVVSVKSLLLFQSGSLVFCCSVWVFCYYYYYLSNSDLVRWCCCHVSSGVIPTPRTHMVGCFCAVTLIWLD